MGGLLAPQRLQCFGGPADGQWITAGLTAEHITVNAHLLFYNPRFDGYGAVSIVQACYQAMLLPIGEGNLFRSRLLLKHVPPARDDDD